MQSSPSVSVIISAHNPNPGRLRRTLLGLRGQTLPLAQWETLIVDNASARFPRAEFFLEFAPANFSLLDEPVLGLARARRRGFAAARSEIFVLVDDDNVLAPDYLSRVLAIFAQYPGIGAIGGKSIPEFETAPPEWTKEFHGLLALRDLGSSALISHGLRPAGADRDAYPRFAPIGAGMALRRDALKIWLASQQPGAGGPSDRCGNDLTSAGDNDIVLAVMRAGWEVGYFPELSLVHQISAARFEPDYLARLNRGIQKSWMQVLTLHRANPWSPLTRSSATLRKVKTWLTYRGWSRPAGRIRWQGACGHFDGRVGS